MVRLPDEAEGCLRCAWCPLTSATAYFISLGKPLFYLNYVYIKYIESH